MFLQDDLGPYCVNWNIKDDESGFRQQTHGTLRRRSSARADEHVQRRQQIERHYYADAQIPTMEIAGTDFDADVRTQLQLLLPIRLTGVPLAVTRDLEVLLNEGIESERPPQDSFAMVTQRHGVAEYTCIEIAKHLVWNKRVPVDLYSPVLWEKPLRRASRCVLRERAAWFRRWSA